MSAPIARRPTICEINLDNLAENFRASRQFIGPEYKYMAIVKADAYGHGAVECSNRLEAEGVDWFGVAIPEEGVELRRAGIRAPILCLGSFWHGQETIVIDNDLTPVVFDIEKAASLSHAAAARGQTVDIHVKIDTGMGRVGVRHDEAARFAKHLTTFGNLNVTGLMTHFAVADDPRQDEFTVTQMARFDEALAAFHDVAYRLEIIDLANSPGAISHPQSRGNLVRLGGALYGLLDDILPPGAEGPNLKPVASLRSRIAYLKNVPKGDDLGYGRTFTTKRDSQIALVPVGYADGYARGLSNKASALVNEQIVPVVGRVSMDWTLLDVTDLDHVRVDDQVTLIGSDGANEITAADLARQLGTIGYEVTCCISARVPRVFTGL